MWVREAEAMNVITGMFPEMYGEDKYDIDDSWQPRGSVWVLEGTKGGKTYEWGPPPKVTNYWDAITESEKRTLAFIDKAVEAKKPFFISHQPLLLSFVPDPRNPKKRTANKNALAERLEALRGDRAGQYSIRINQQWRICFEWPAGDPGPSNVEIVDYH